MSPCLVGLCRGPKLPQTGSVPLPFDYDLMQSRALSPLFSKGRGCPLSFELSRGRGSVSHQI